VKLQRDPVCGTYVTPGSALTTTAAGTTLYFCSEKCRNEYLAR
jgi:YHS domain-containing protein